MAIDSVMPSNHLFLYCPLLLLPSLIPSIRVFSSELAVRIRWPKYWSFSISPSNEYSGLISFRIDCFDLLVVQGILKSLLQHHSLKASIFQGSGFFVIQLSQFSSVQLLSRVRLFATPFYTCPNPRHSSPSHKVESLGQQGDPTSPS